MPGRVTRRQVISAAVGAIAGSSPGTARAAVPAWSLPIGLPGRIPGDGFIIRHGYACENTWYNPGWWHTAEDYYLIEGNTAGAGVFAVADGEIVFAGSDYPGLVVILRHAEDLFSMYGHLDVSLAVEQGAVARGQLLGTVLDRTDGRAPSHLHVEIRTFLTTTEVNGDAPRYGVGCGDQCPPGPGYWPIDAPEHPSAIGWRNPTNLIARRAFAGEVPRDAAVVVASGAREVAPLWSLPADRRDAARLGELPLTAGTRFPLVDIATGPEDSTRTSAEGYRLWYRIAAPGIGLAWAQGAIPNAVETGADGRPSAVRLDFLIDPGQA